MSAIPLPVFKPDADDFGHEACCKQNNAHAHFRRELHQQSTCRHQGDTTWRLNALFLNRNLMLHPRGAKLYEAAEHGFLADS
jgi:hypothetical protein